MHNRRHGSATYRMASAGRVVIPALAIPTVYFIHGNSIELVCVLIATVLMLIRHRKGIYRIIHGEEPLHLKLKKINKNTL